MSGQGGGGCRGWRAETVHVADCNGKLRCARRDASRPAPGNDLKTENQQPVRAPDIRDQSLRGGVREEEVGANLFEFGIFHALWHHHHRWIGGTRAVAAIDLIADSPLLVRQAHALEFGQWIVQRPTFGRGYGRKKERKGPWEDGVANGLAEERQRARHETYAKFAS
jgi:hypothetical protein